MVWGSTFNLDSGKSNGREGVGNGMDDTVVLRDLPLGFGRGSTDLVMTKLEVIAVGIRKVESMKGSIM